MKKTENCFLCVVWFSRLLILFLVWRENFQTLFSEEQTFKNTLSSENQLFLPQNEQNIARKNKFSVKGIEKIVQYWSLKIIKQQKGSVNVQLGFAKGKWQQRRRNSYNSEGNSSCLDLTFCSTFEGTGLLIEEGERPYFGGSFRKTTMIVMLSFEPSWRQVSTNSSTASFGSS